jgi:hypothetical protein
MSYMVATDREQTASEHLEIVRTLIAELARAMRAISCNAISDLEESLAEQQILVARLRDLRPQDRCTVVSTNLSLDRQLADEIILADAELVKLNRVYGAVLQHSSHSSSLMAVLLGSFKGQFPEASGPRLKYQTWSCQM